jgi:hypothetical protein
MGSSSGNRFPVLASSDINSPQEPKPGRAVCAVEEDEQVYIMKRESRVDDSVILGNTPEEECQPPPK